MEKLYKQYKELKEKEKSKMYLFKSGIIYFDLDEVLNLKHLQILMKIY